MMDEKIYQRQITKQSLADAFIVSRPLPISEANAGYRTARGQQGIVSQSKNSRIYSPIEKHPATHTTSSTVPAKIKAISSTENAYTTISSLHKKKTTDSSPHLS
jgi:hypothetical protein